MDSEKKVFYKKLFSLVLPIAFQNFMLSLVSASDALMLGRLDQSSMSAVSLAGQVMFVFLLFLGSMTIGASMFVAQYYGKKDITDGISVIETEVLNGNVYNLQGQKVEKAVKGLYIVNGKKVVLK